MAAARVSAATAPASSGAAFFPLWGAHPRVDRLVMAVSPALLAVNVALFVSHYWVA